MCLRFLLICFGREINDFYQSSLENEADFRDTVLILEKLFSKWKSIDNNVVNIFLSLENLYTFLLA